MPTITVRVDDPGSPPARALIAQLDAYLTSRYPMESNHLLPVEALQQPNVTFLTAAVDGQVAGCGAFIQHGAEYAEIKRMFVVPQFRGCRVGRRLLDELESRIRGSGLTLARLETGIYQAEALRLYERAGYERRGPFGDYAADPLSVFMEKKVA
jgi:putative acetyltransferase